MQSQNQFQMTPEQGQLDLCFNPNTISVKIGAGSAGGLLPGQSVKIVDDINGIPNVVECATDAEDVFGFINYDIKSKSFNAGDKAEISFLSGNVMYMTASAAIARNAKVMVVIASKKVATATTTKMIIGRALDKATADGQLIRVAILLPGTLAP